MDSYAKKIRSLREGKNVTQEEAASALGVTRPTYNAIETGKRDLTVEELHKLCVLLGITVEQFLFSSSQSESYESRMAKYKELILNCLQCGATMNDPGVGKTKLALMVYMCDFASYYENKISLSMLSYRHTAYGPIADAYYRMIDELYDEGAITIELRGRAILLYANEPAAPHSLLTLEELELIKKVCEPWHDQPTQAIVDFVKGNTPWKKRTLGEIIAYDDILDEQTNPFLALDSTKSRVIA